jgi:hypothetical protein
MMRRCAKLLRFLGLFEFLKLQDARMVCCESSGTSDRMQGRWAYWDIDTVSMDRQEMYPRECKAGV